MLPKGVDPLFPNKRLVGYDALGRPQYDMAATGLTVYGTWTPHPAGYIAITDEVINLTDDDWTYIIKRMKDAINAETERYIRL